MLSHQNKGLNELFLYYQTALKAFQHYRKSIEKNSVVDNNYIGFTKQELREIFDGHVEELEQNACLSILSAVEANFRIDYLIRVNKKFKDSLSRRFRKMYKEKEQAVSLEQDILTLWKQEHPDFKMIISDYVGALKYRHWLAHGRYWKPKLGRKFDIATIMIIAQRLYENIPFCEAEMRHL